MRYAYEYLTCKKDGADAIVKALTPAPVILEVQLLQVQ